MCEERIAIVTGAGRGIGRAHALELARNGAKVVVNDIGSALDGTGSSGDLAQNVVDEIRDSGGTAVANSNDVSNWSEARDLIQCAISNFGGLDILVNNAGILRDRMIVNMTEDEWDSVIKVHLKGTFSTVHWAANYWRDRFKEGLPNDARIINTASASGLYGNNGQSNYGAAKAGIASLTIIASQELDRYGITVNAIAPAALTRMTENLGFASKDDDPSIFQIFAPENISPLVVWLSSTESSQITGRVFDIMGGHIDVAQGWHAGPGVDKINKWNADELSDVIPNLVSKAAKNADMTGRISPSS